MSKYNHILVAIDLAEGSLGIAKNGIELAEKMEAKLSLVHIVEPMPSLGYAFVGSEDLDSQLIENAKKQLSELASQLQFKNVEKYIVMGIPKVEIVRLVSELNVDLIILGIHDHHGFGHLLSSTANTIIHRVSSDVLTVRVHKNI